MLNSKQRAYLRSLANPLPPVVQIGKEEIGDNLILQIDTALEARELIKVSLLETAALSAKEACALICGKTGAQGVQCIGRRFVLYRQAREEKNRKICLPR